MCVPCSFLCSPLMQSCETIFLSLREVGSPLASLAGHSPTCFIEVDREGSLHLSLEKSTEDLRQRPMGEIFRYESKDRSPWIRCVRETLIRHFGPLREKVLGSALRKQTMQNFCLSSFRAYDQTFALVVGSGFQGKVLVAAFVLGLPMS